MRYYEILYIINSNFEQGKINETMNMVSHKLEETKSKIISHHIWGKKRLSYPIQNQKYGTYILLQFEDGDRVMMNDFDTWMKLENLVLRHITIRLDNRPKVIKNIEDSIEDEKKLETNDISIESSVKDNNIDNEQTIEILKSVGSENEDDK